MNKRNNILEFLLPSGVIDKLDNERLRKLVMTGAGSLASAVRQSEQTAQDLIQQSREGVLVIQDKLIVQINPRLCEWAGYTVEEVRGTPFSKFIGEKDVKDVVANYHLRMADVAVPPVYEAAIKRKDGSTFRGEIRAARFLYRGNYADLVFITPHDTCTPNCVRKS